MTITVDRTCKSCRYFSVDKVGYMKHASAGLGHCEFDRASGSLATFRGTGSTCEKYDATDVRKAYLKFKGIE